MASLHKSNQYYVVIRKDKTLDLGIMRQQLHTQHIVIHVKPHVMLIINDTFDGISDNGSLTLYVHNNAHVSYKGSAPVQGIYALEVHAYRQSRVEFIQIGSIAKSVNQSVHIALHDQSAEVDINYKATLFEGAQYQLDTHQHHKAPLAQSHVGVKLVQYGASKSTYTGMIAIAKNGSQSQAHLKHASLLLSPESRAYAEPNIEVHTHDVQCGHGSAIGQLDIEELYYLQSRGIPLKKAQSLLVQAFLND